MTDAGNLPSIEEQAATWCWRLADGDLTSAEQADFDLWVRADPAHRQALEEMVAVWQGTDAIAEMPGMLALRGKALEEMDRAGRSEEPLRGRGKIRRVLAIAASLALLVVTSLYLLHDPVDRYDTGIGERRVVRLADSSKVSLDASSQVLVDYRDDGRRLNLLSGRAKFDVAHDPARPFSVTAGGKTIVATGTAFSVEILGNDVHVLLYEGRIRILSADGAGDAAASGPPAEMAALAGGALKPGDELITGLSGGGAQVVQADLPNSLTWEGGRLSFVNEPLAVAVERVNRYAEKPIRISDGATGRLVVNGVFNAGDTIGFLSGLQSLFAVEVREGERSWTVSGAPR